MRYFLALYHEGETLDRPRACVTGLTLPASPEEVQVRLEDMAHALAEWIKTHGHELIGVVLR